MSRTYLDWNASAPLRPEARAAMAAALEVGGNPSSVHCEGRAARAVVERARAQVAEAVGAEPEGVIFTSGATEAAALALRGQGWRGAGIEHDCVAAWVETDLPVSAGGAVRVDDPAGSVLQAANPETGIVQSLPEGLALTDAVQVLGKRAFAFSWTGARRAIVSGHKIGGPRGVGALVLAPGVEVQAQMRGGGQETGRRAGTENVAAIAGFGAACAAAMRDLADGVWDAVAARRDLMEAALEDAAPTLICVGKGAARLPNTSCLAVPGWAGETQVMQMDLAGFAISAGSACSSGKVRRGRVLEAMGFDAETASGAIRVSIGPQTPEEDVLAFVRAWTRQYEKFRKKAA